MAEYLQAHKEYDLAFVRKYHGEITFLARLEKAVDYEEMKTIEDWLETHPNGRAIIRYNRPEQVSKYEMLFDMPYRGKRMGVFKKK